MLGDVWNVLVSVVAVIEHSGASVPYALRARKAKSRQLSSIQTVEFSLL